MPIFPTVMINANLPAEPSPKPLTMYNIPATNAIPNIPPTMTHTTLNVSRHSKHLPCGPLREKPTAQLAQSGPS